MMNLEIGGYFPLELRQGKELFEHAIRLNSGRSCLRYLIRSYHIQDIYIPQFTCPVVWETLEQEACRIYYYSITSFCLPKETLPKDGYILYTNYYGTTTKQARQLEKEYPNLIVDASQGFYCPKIGLATFNSARKFFGVSDGAYLMSDCTLQEELEQDSSADRFSHLLLRSDLGAEAGYWQFHENEEKLCYEPLKRMSKLTRNLLRSIDYEAAARMRRENFYQLHQALKDINEFQIDLDAADVPMAYPFLYRDDMLRKKVLADKLYVPCFWQGQKDGDVGRLFEKYLLPLPIDQRYHWNDMEKIIACIYAHIK